MIQANRQIGPIVPLECAGIQTLIHLLRLTLKTTEPTTDSSSSSSITAQLQALLLLAQSTESAPKTIIQDSNTNKDFFAEINARLPTALIVLLQLVVVASSPLLRLEAASLCSLLLLEIRDCWETTDVPDIALDMCLVLTQDQDGTKLSDSPPDLFRISPLLPRVVMLTLVFPSFFFLSVMVCFADRVAADSQTTLEEYQLSLTLNDKASSLVPRILDMIEELPTLAQAQKQLELQTKLKLISGYLKLIDSGGGSVRLATESVSLAMRKALTGAFQFWRWYQMLNNSKLEES